MAKVVTVTLMSKVAIIVSTFNRINLLKKTLESLEESLKDDKNDVTIYICNDGSTDGTMDFVLSNLDKYKIITFNDNHGLRVSLNRLLKETLTKDYEYICYVQDDVEFKDGWLDECIYAWENTGNMGFITCHDAPEHLVVLSGVSIKNWKIKKTCRATHLFASTERWKRFGVIPDLTPGIAAPKPGHGSKVDWWLVGHPEGKYPESEHSLRKDGEFVLVIPGYVKHTGVEDSTWLPKDGVVVAEDGVVWNLTNPEYQ